MRNVMKLLLVLTLTLGPSIMGTAQERGATTGTGPSFEYLGLLAQGPGGVVFAADAQEVSVYALELGDALRGGAPGTARVEALDRKLAALLGTDVASIEITDMLVYPANRNTLVSVMRGEGVGAQAALVRIDGEGKLTNIPLASIRYSKLMMPNPPPKEDVFVMGTNTLALPNYPDTPKSNPIRAMVGTRTLTDMAFDNGKLYVAGLSSEEFGAKMRVISYPFRTVDSSTSVELWHAAHGQFETRSPINTFVPYNVKGERHIIASYACTPLVKVPVSELKPGADVRGVTIGEFGNGSRPLDMVVYTKDGRDYLLMSNTKRGVMKVPTSGFADTAPILRQVQVEDRVGVIPETVTSLTDVEQLDKFDATRAVIIAKRGNGLNLETVAFP